MNTKESTQRAVNRWGPARRRTPHVIVIGGGVSGCASAARLAACGLKATVVSSALDVVGLPGYGPYILGGSGGWDEIESVLSLLPVELRRVWISCSYVPEDPNIPLLVVDRRAISVETKRTLERTEGIAFRQGLVTNLQVQRGSRVSDFRAVEPVATGATIEVETAFAERLDADAVIVAAGLALAGQVEIGSYSLPGGRYGEVPADDLYHSLERCGFSFVEKVIHVGSRYASPLGRAQAMPSLPIIEDEDGENEGGERIVTESGLRGLLPAGLGCSGSGRLVPARRRLAHLWEPCGLEMAGVVETEDLERMVGQEKSSPRLPHEKGEEDSVFTVSENEEVLIQLWPKWFPPAPHFTEGLRQEVLTEYRIGLSAKGSSASASDGEMVPLEEGWASWDEGVFVDVPDGVATAERYVTASGEYEAMARKYETAGRPEARLRVDGEERKTSSASLAAGEAGKETVPPGCGGLTRCGSKIRAKIAVGIDAEGRAARVDNRIRIVGRAAGAAGYLESLRSGIAVADALAQWFGCSDEPVRSTRS